MFEKLTLRRCGFELGYVPPTLATDGNLVDRNCVEGFRIRNINTSICTDIKGAISIKIRESVFIFIYVHYILTEKYNIGSTLLIERASINMSFIWIFLSV